MKPQRMLSSRAGVPSSLPLCLAFWFFVVLFVAQVGAAGETELLRVPAVSASTRSIAESSVEGRDFTCYEAGSSNRLCFTVYNNSIDGERIDLVRLTMPDLLGAWEVSCFYQSPTDSKERTVHMTCQVPALNEVIYFDSQSNGAGEISYGASWWFCNDVWVPSAYAGPRIVNWGLSGDEFGDPPHDTTGTLTIEPCTPLILEPEVQRIEGCNARPNWTTIGLWNNTGSDGTFDFFYDVISGNAEVVGPPSLHASDSLVYAIDIEIVPDHCVMPGQTVDVSVSASGNGASDEMEIVLTAAVNDEFREGPPLTTSTMDNVVVWAVHDGALWTIGGYGASGGTQRLDLGTGAWSSHAGQPVPAIGYPMDACYGLNADGDEVVVLFPDTAGDFNQQCLDQNEVDCVMQRYNITDDAWDEPWVPDGYPPIGRWGQDIVSLYPLTGENVCYLSGGSPAPGGGQVNNLWEYHPDTNLSVFLGNFSYAPAGFNFHSSWFVPWVGNAGSICVAGGIDPSQEAMADSQCYDRSADVFNPPNADLGPLPETWWGGADGWDVHEGRHRLWLADGANTLGDWIGRSAYADSTTGGFVYGPSIDDPAVIRSEGSGVDGRFVVVGGGNDWISLGIPGSDFTRYTRVRWLAPCPERLPAHDACESAEPVGPGIHHGQFACATADGASTCTSGADVDVWYRFVAPEHGILHVRTCGTNDLPAEDEGPDTSLSVHHDCSGSQLPGVCNDDWPAGLWPEACVGLDHGVAVDAALPLDVVAGQDYLIRLARYEDASAVDYVFELQLEVPAGRIPAIHAGPEAPLLLNKMGDEVWLNWSPSCLPDGGYAVYRGTIGVFDQHEPVTCESPDPFFWWEVPGPEDFYYLVVPNNPYSEGSYGIRSIGGAASERPASPAACNPQAIGACP